jgi:hypothetical protein
MNVKLHAVTLYIPNPANVKRAGEGAFFDFNGLKRRPVPGILNPAKEDPESRFRGI